MFPHRSSRNWPHNNSPDEHELNHVGRVGDLSRDEFSSREPPTPMDYMPNEWSQTMKEPLTGNNARSTAYAPGRSAVSTQASFMYEGWLLEIFGIIMSTAASLAIVVVLKVYDNQSLPSWPIGITLNAFVSLFSTVAKATMLLPVSSCISQLKWRWFSKSRTLGDFEMFDEASRGPWGAFQLLARKHSIQLVTVGALITLVALLIDPFMQQIISYELRPVEVGDLAKVARAQIYDAHLGRGEFGGGLQLGPDFGMKAAIYNGIFTKPNSSAIIPDCSSGNCTIPLFDTLAFCSKCMNVTDKTTLSQHTKGKPGNNSVFPDADENNFTYALPGNTSITASAYYQPGLESGPNIDLSYGPAMISTTNVSSSMSKDVLGVTSPLISLGVLQFPEVNAEGYSGNYFNTTPLAWECALYFCLNIYNVTVKNGQANTSLTTSWHGENGVDIDLNDLGATPDAVLQRPASNASLGGNSTFTVTGVTVATLAQYLNMTLSGMLLTHTTEVPFGTFVDDVMQALNETSDIGIMMSGLATSMTDYLRTADTDSNTAQVTGTAFKIESYVHVRWAWLAHPSTLLLMSITLLIATIILSHRHRTPVWKSSSLATLLHGLDTSGSGVERPAGSIDNLAQMDAVAADTKVVLQQTTAGDWRLQTYYS